MLAFLNQVRKPTLDLPLDVRRKMWFKPFMQSYLVVFIGYLTMYLIRKNFNIAQNDMISTYGLSMTQLGMIGLGFSITYGVGKTLVSYYADGKNTKQFLPFMLILSAICMLGFSASMGAGSTSLFLMIAFYALSGFFQSTGGSCSYSTITKWTPRRKRGTFLGFWNISHNLGGAGAAGVALFGANYLFDGHVIGMFIFPSIIALIVGFIGLRYGSDSPESYGLGTAEELFGEAISEEDKETEENAMTKWQIFVEYVLKNKVIWLLCFSNIFLYVVRIGIDQWSTVYAFQELKLSKEVAIQGFTLFEVGAPGRHAAVGLAVGSGQRPPRAGGLHRAGADYRHPRGLPTRQQPVRLSGLVICAGLPGVWSAAVDRRRRRRFRTEKSDRRRRWDQGHLRLSDRR